MSGSYVVYPGYVDQPGLVDGLTSAGIGILARGDGLFYVTNLPAAQAFIAAWTPALSLVWLKSNGNGTGKMDQLLNYATANFSLLAFIELGTANPVTAAQVSGFLASWTNNFRTLRTSIQNAADAATLAAINILSGWPANP